jgi:hypothetical protein
MKHHQRCFRHISIHTNEKEVLMKIVINVKMKTVIMILVWAYDTRNHTSPIIAMMMVPVFKLQEKQQKLYFGTSGTCFIVNTMVAGYTLRPGS